jgi:hypothetical protein
VRNQSWICLITLVCVCTFGSTARGADPLAVARDLAETKYKNWKYGSDAGQQQVDCVQFVLATIEECLQMTLGPDARKRILITDVTADEVAAGTVIANGDPRTKGVQQALVELGKGEVVQITDVAAGDFIQFWKKDAQGAWKGHSAIIEEVIKDGNQVRVKLFGAHASINGVGSTKPPQLILKEDDDRKIYLVRLRS